jgi:hypothetical protein
MMTISFPETPSPEECACTIFEISGTKFDPEIATGIWAKILQHKWLMSEKLGCDVGLRTPCIDFLENMDQALKEYTDYERQDVLSEMGAQIISSLGKFVKVDSHYRIAFLTAALTGVRSGELWGLQWNDINWTLGQVYVRRALWKGHFQTPKTNNSIRKIDLLPQLVYELKHWKTLCPVNDYNLVFPSPEGSMSIHENVVKRYFNPALKQACVRRVSFHSLRHTNASIRIEAGQNIKYIQLQMGHASIQTTLDRYGHLVREVNTEQVRRLENVLGYVENSDSSSDTENKSVRRMLEDFGKKESEGFVNPLPHKALEAIVNA